ncbi:hypothetical protein TYRP_022713 [Tyrophagus putrescentiae]|nr:hypothetical protein TYRP_022713 [Tyrophagus putrescentiae]
MLINGHQSVAAVMSKQCSDKLSYKKNVVQCSICMLFLSDDAFNNHHLFCNNVGDKMLVQTLAIAVLEKRLLESSLKTVLPIEYLVKTGKGEKGKGKGEKENGGTLPPHDSANYKLTDFNDYASDDEAFKDCLESGRLFDTDTGELLCSGNGDFQFQLETPQQTHSAFKDSTVLPLKELPPLEYSPQTAQLKGHTDQYIDARLGVTVETAEPGRGHLQDAFRQGELRLSENKTKKCPFCFLYYQATYIGAHSQLCLKNTRPDTEPGSRVALYREALNRAQNGIFDDSLLIATPKMEFNLTKNAWLPNCDCTVEDKNVVADAGLKVVLHWAYKLRIKCSGPLSKPLKEQK